MTQQHFNLKKLFIMTFTTGALLTSIFLGQGMAARDGKAYSGWSYKPWTLPNANSNFKYDNWGRIQKHQYNEALERPLSYRPGYDGHKQQTVFCFCGVL